MPLGRGGQDTPSTRSSLDAQPRSSVRTGFERVAMLLHTGHVDRPDILIAAPAACVTGGLVFFSLWGYPRARNKRCSNVRYSFA
jgi:hypothetical protein